MLQVLDALEDSLALATIDENWKNRVGRQTELRAKSNAPDLTIRYMGHFQILNLEGHEITIGAMATDEQIAAEIARIRPNKPTTEKTNMSVLGLESGAFQAKLAEIRARVAAKQVQGLEKIDGAATAGVAKIEAAADVVVEKVGREIDAQIEEFAAFGDNGGA